MKKSIAIAGNMGAGKSTLVDFLSYTYGGLPFYEPNEDNPYLPDFYLDMRCYGKLDAVHFCKG